MASDLLHIKDSYYFDVPKMFWASRYDSAEAIADGVGPWAVRNDSDYQDWEADKAIQALRDIVPNSQALDGAKEAWKAWQHADELHHNRPFDQYVIDALAEFRKEADQWAKTQSPKPGDAAVAYVAEKQNPQLEWMVQLQNDETQWRQFTRLRSDLDEREVLNEYLASPRADWSESKLRDFNYHLSGKVFIPQPFATLRNAYETETGFGISRYMIIEVVVAIIMLFLFRWLAGKVQTGQAPRGKFWNLLESMVQFVKTDVVEKGIEPHDSPRFMPLFWTLFFFILGCNLMGMLPWVGSPTAALYVTAVLAFVVFLVGTFLGVRKFGVVGYLKNLCPDLGLPIYLAIFIVPMVWIIEFASLFIKHVILAIRLLLNMAAGHLVLLGIMGLAFSAQAATMQFGSWSAISVIALLGTTILSFLELFVAFLQAYVFTLLASLFVGSATHHH
ncbi:MAG: F0F1 ATP synthase subunit A [bacterium]|nr:F0F1 ATP synthase subunit A [bacterium]